MRTLPLVLMALLLAGCASNPSPPTATAAQPLAAAASPAPLHVEGMRFLPPSQGPDRERSAIAFPVNATGEAIVAKLHLGSRYVVDLPTSTAEVTAQLVDATNATLAKATLRSGAEDATLRVTSNATGTHKLVLLSYGGSDGSSMGDYVSYVIDAKEGAK